LEALRVFAFWRGDELRQVRGEQKVERLDPFGIGLVRVHFERFERSRLPDGHPADRRPR